MLRRLSNVPTPAAFPLEVRHDVAITTPTNMQQIEQDIRAFQDVWEDSKHDYSLTPPQSFMDAYREANTRYVRQCAEIVAVKHSIPVDLQDFLETCVYLANQRAHDDEIADYDAELSRKGFTLCVPEWAKAFQGALRVDVVILRDSLMGEDKKVVSNCRALWDENGLRAVLPPRHKSSGYVASRIHAIRLAA